MKLFETSPKEEPWTESDWTSAVSLRSPRILVVEDDEDLRAIFEKIVHAVSSYVDIDWAGNVDIAQGFMFEQLYDIVIADYLLGGEESGLSLRPLCESRQPQATFAMMSAYPLADLLPSVGGARSPFLRKPFTTTECRRFVRKLLNDVI